MHNLKAGRLLGQGANGILCVADWLGEPYAIKIAKYGYEEFFKREIAALSGLHHPHIMHLVCCRSAHTSWSLWIGHSPKCWKTASSPLSDMWM